jgi:hypothetical protein
LNNFKLKITSLFAKAFGKLTAFILLQNDVLHNQQYKIFMWNIWKQEASYRSHVQNHGFQQNHFFAIIPKKLFVLKNRRWPKRSERPGTVPKIRVVAIQGNPMPAVL